MRDFKIHFENLGGIILGVVSLTVLIVTLAFGFFVTRIGTGYLGVVYSPNGGIKEEPLTQGWHVVNPFYSISKYSIATEQAFLSKDAREGSEEDESFVVPTSDGKLVNVDIEFSYHFDPDRVTKTFTQFRGRDGKTIEKTFMRGKIKTWVAEVTSKFNVLDIYGDKRSELNMKSFEHVKAKFDPFGIVIESVNISRIGLDRSTEKAIQARVNSQQELERQKIEAKKAKIEAERKRIEAEGIKKVQIIEAQAKADTLKIQAEGEAQAIITKSEAIAEGNRRIASTLTNNLIKMEQIKKWNGTVPQVTSDTTNPILDLRQ